MPRRVRLYAGMVNYLTERSEVVAKNPGRQGFQLLVDPLLDFAVLDAVRPAPAEPRPNSLPVDAVVLASTFVNVDSRLEPEGKPIVKYSLW